MEDIEKLIGKHEKVKLITLLRTFKKEGIENFIVIRKYKLENLIKRYRELEKKNKQYEEIYKEYGIDDLVRKIEELEEENKKLKAELEKKKQNHRRNGNIFSRHRI